MSEAKTEKKAGIPFFSAFFKNIIKDKKALIIHAVLQAITVYSGIRCLLEGNYNNAMLALLATALYLIPAAVETLCRVHIPTVLKSIAFLFAFCAEILGEINGFYGIFPFWDAILHAICGFIFAAFGFCLADIFGKKQGDRPSYSPLLLALLAFCFSMTIGVFWEFFEYTGDTFFGTDMQKDHVLHSIHSYILPHYEGSGAVVNADGIAEMILYDTEGNVITRMPGYLDIGITDTILDMIINFVGALAFSIIGYFYVKHDGKGRFARQFIPTALPDDPKKRAQENTENN